MSDLKLIMAKREVEIVVISDVHLGTYGCHAKELLKYLKSVKPKVLVLNGDIIDIWQFSKSYWPDAHMKVVRRIMKFVTEGVPVYYLTGNHDELLRKFTDFEVGSLQIIDKLVLNIDGKKAWIFHGDVFDVTMQYSKWLAKLGAVGYDTLILLNTFVNFVLNMLGKPKMSFSQKIKNGVKSAVKFINDFETTAIGIAAEKGYEYVICGHIHHPEIKAVQVEGKTVTYLNSGDWVESLSALEYNQGEWTIYKYNPNDFEEDKDDPQSLENEDLEEKLDVSVLYQKMISGDHTKKA